MMLRLRGLELVPDREPGCARGAPAAPPGARLRLACGLALALALGGCAGFSAGRRGQSLLESGQFEGAVAAFRQATQEAPDNRAYQEGLLRAQRAATQQALAAAQAAQRGGDLNQALAACARGLAFSPGSPEVLALQPVLEQALAQARARVASARAALGVRRHGEALEHLAALLPLLPTFPQELPALQQAAQLQAESDALTAQAQALAQAGRFGEALPLFAAALARDASNTAAEGGQRAALLGEGGRLQQAAQAARGQHRLGSAVTLWERAAELFTQAAAAQRVTAVQREAAAGRKELAARLRQQAEAARRKGMLGLCWARLRAAEVLSPTGAALPDVEPALRLRVASQIAGDEAMGAELGGQLGAWLGRFAGAGRVEQVSGAADLSLQLSVSPVETTIELARREQRAQRYVRRIEQVDNPAWLTLREEIRQHGFALQRLDARLSQAQAQLGVLVGGAQQARGAAQQAGLLREESDRKSVV